MPEVIIYIIAMLFLILGFITLWKVDNVLLSAYDVKYNNVKIEVADYNPKTDTLAIFVGTENEVPPRDVIERIADELNEIPECKLLVCPGILRFVILKNAKKSKTK